MGNKKKKIETPKNRQRPLVEPPHQPAPPKQIPLMQGQQADPRNMKEFELVAQLNAEYGTLMRCKANIDVINAELMRRFKPPLREVELPKEEPVLPKKPESPIIIKEKIIKKKV